jgi:hypothetical protein
MMTKPLSPQEIELLSAYLDHELDPAETARLESRLQVETELKDTLTELRKTRQVLRSLPLMRAPRNFTLTPAMAGVRKQERSRLRWFSTLRFSSALAGLLLVLVVLGDLLTGVTSLPVPVPGQVLSAQVESEGEAAQAPAGPAAQLAQQATSEPTPVGQMRIQALAPNTTAEENTPEAGTEFQAVTPEAPAGGESSADTQAPGSTEAPVAPPFARGLGGGGGGGGGSEILPGEQPTPAPFLTQAEVRSGVRTLEVGLAIIAVVAALAAWWVRRRGA